MVKVCFAILSYKTKVLICYENRSQFKNQWEFPGGKIEENETILQALIRELNEEIGLSLNQFYSLGHYFTDSIQHQKIQVFLFYQELNKNQYHSIEPKIYQKIKFVDKKDILKYHFLNGSYGAIYRYLLPNCYMITSEPEDDLVGLIDNWESQINNGIRLIQLRAKKISHHSRLELAKKLKEKMDSYDGLVLVNSDLEVAKQLNIGIHLPSNDLLRLNRRPLSKQSLISTSCHNDKAMNKAKRLADIALISPVNQNRYFSGNNSQLMSHQKIQDYSKGDLVTYALSGMKKTDIPWVQSLGSHGIAGICAFKDG